MNDELKVKNEKFEQLSKTFEELLREKFSISELRDFWRTRAGIDLPSDNDNVSNDNNG